MIYLIILLGIVLFIFNFSIKNVETFDNSNKFIEKIYVINLDRRKDRLEHIKRDCKNANINFERFSAVNGKELNKHQEYIDKYIDTSKNLKNGQIGCALSHIKIWEDIVKNGYSNTVILEDDGFIPNNFNTVLKNSLNSLPKKWDLVSFNCSWCQATAYNKYLYKLNTNICTLSYLVSNEGARKLLHLFSKKKMGLPIDVELNNNFYKYNNCFITKKSHIYNKGEFESDIGIGNGGIGQHKINLIT